MRVLSVGNMYPPHHLGGYELMWRSSVHHLRARGDRVRVLTTDYRTPWPEPSIVEDPDVHRDLRWYWHEHAFPRMSAWSRWRLERRNGATFARHVDEFRPDVIAWWAMGGMSLSLLERAARRGIPAVGLVVDDWLDYGRRTDGWQRLVPRALAAPVEALTGVPTRIDLDRAAHWVFVSEAVRRKAIRAGLSPEAESIAHAGIDAALFPRAEPEPWRHRLLYVGRIDERKGIATAVEALAMLEDAYTLRIVGSGDEEHLVRLDALTRELGITDRVTRERVPRPDLAAVYAGADVTLFPVVWDEPWGLVPLESMAVGRPVIATGSGGSGEYLEHESNCLIFEAGDPRALAASIRRLAEDDRLRDALREGGLETAGRFTEDGYNAQVADALEKAAR